MGNIRRSGLGLAIVQTDDPAAINGGSAGFRHGLLFYFFTFYFLL